MLLAVDPARELVLVRGFGVSFPEVGSIDIEGSGKAQGRPLVGEGALGCDVWLYGYLCEPTIGGAVRAGTLDLLFECMNGLCVGCWPESWLWCCDGELL